jgi:hypothetical protein
VSTLIERLLAAIDEDEAVARLMPPFPWRLNDEGDEVIAADGEQVCEPFAFSNQQTRNMATFFVRFDPQRMLDEVAAKREILELHVRVVLRDGGGADFYRTTDVCRSCEPRRGALVGEHSWPCPTLLATAKVYGIEEGN